MKPVTNQPGVRRRPIDLLDPEARKALKSSRRAYRRTATVRGRIGSTEDRLRDWERRVVAKGSTARQWKSLLEEGQTLLADAGGVQLEVRQVEQQALKLLRAGLEAVHQMAADTGNDTADRVYRLLDRCERLRAEELEWLDQTLAETHLILNLPRSAAPDQVLSRLEQRRKVAARIGTRLRDAEQLELKAVGVLTGAVIPVDGTRTGEPTPVDRIVKGETSMSSRRKKSPAPVSVVPETESSAPPEEEQTVLAPLAGLGAEFHRAADRVEEMRAEVEGRIAALVERLEVEHAAVLEEEGRQRAEIEEQLGDLRAERKGFEERVLVAENAAEELRAGMSKLEEETRKERDRLSADRSRMHARVLASESERDEALVLVASLMRRLKTPGLDEEAGEEE